jgi:hypothetical protein
VKEVVVSGPPGTGFWMTRVPVDGLLWMRFHHGTLVVLEGSVKSVVLLIVVVVVVVVVLADAVVVVAVVVLLKVVVVLVVVVAGEVMGSIPPLSTDPEVT